MVSVVDTAKHATCEIDDYTLTSTQLAVAVLHTDTYSIDEVVATVVVVCDIAKVKQVRHTNLKIILMRAHLRFPWP